MGNLTIKRGKPHYTVYTIYFRGRKTAIQTFFSGGRMARGRRHYITLVDDIYCLCNTPRMLVQYSNALSIVLV